MFINNYYSEKNSKILISKQQASDFAKTIADDFNPIHDQDSKNFCVPGDLLFSLILQKYGLSQKMAFTFSGMVGDNVPLNFPISAAEFSITDDNEKQYLNVVHQGEVTNDKNLIETFSKNYVSFSGKNFPDLIVPLMEEHNVMINPARPLVIYESMSIDLETLNIKEPTLELTNTSLTVQGKKGKALLEFSVTSDGKIIGKGLKTLALRGLSEFDQNSVDGMVNLYKERKATLAP